MSSYYQQNRQVAQAKSRTYYMTHKYEIKRKQKKYQRKVSMGTVIPRQRTRVGTSYVYTPGVGGYKF